MKPLQLEHKKVYECTLRDNRQKVDVQYKDDVPTRINFMNSDWIVACKTPWFNQRNGSCYMLNLEIAPPVVEEAPKKKSKK